MLTILAQSGSDQKLKNFRSFTWGSSNNPSNTLSKTFWEVRTNVRKHTFIRYMQLKRLFNQCNETEWRALVDAPGVLKDDLYIDALRAWMTDVPKSILWHRLAILQRFMQKEEWSINLYYTLKNVIAYELIEARTPIRKAKKYSGYTRNSSQVGSKRKNEIFREDPESFEWNTNVEIDYYHFLTVGEFDFGLSNVSSFTLKMSKERTKR